MKKVYLWVFSLLWCSTMVIGQVSEGFESGFVSFSNATGNSLDWSLDTTLSSEGVQSALNDYGNSEENSLISGTLDLTSFTQPLLTFDHIAKTEGSYDFCYVEISSDAGATWNILGTFDEDSYADWGIGTPDNSWWKSETYDLSSYSSNTVVIRFRLASDSSFTRYGWLLDNIVLDEAPSCSAPSSGSISNLTTTSADMNWVESITGETNWNIEWKAGADFTPGNGEQDGSAEPTTTPEYNFTGLTPETTYFVYYQADCVGDDSDLSEWVGPVEFTTLSTCEPPSGASTSNITQDSADMTWTASLTGETNWNIEWKAGADFTPGNGEQDGSAEPTTTPEYNFTGLTLETTYFVYYQADCVGDDSDLSEWVGPIEFTTLGPPPANDTCDGAIDVTVYDENGTVGENTTGDNTNATDSGLPASTCSSTFYQGGDLFYSFTCPTNTDAVDVNIVSSGFSSIILTLYEGTCGSLSQVFCETRFSNSGSFNITGLTPGQTYYLRLYDFDNDNFGPLSFNITFQETLSTLDLESEESKLTVYPNPVQDALHIEGVDVAKAQVYNLSGQLMKVSVENNKINVNHLQKGTYILQTSDEDGNVTSTKFIKK